MKNARRDGGGEARFAVLRKEGQDRPRSSLELGRGYRQNASAEAFPRMTGYLHLSAGEPYCRKFIGVEEFCVLNELNGLDCRRMGMISIVSIMPTARPD